jgi:rhodanese-related sulfurtransferase
MTISMINRLNISVLLISLGLLLVLLPGAGTYSFIATPGEIVSSVIADNPSFSPDEVAEFVVREDSSLQLIDLRSQAEYNEFNIPGSINIPFESFFSMKPEQWLFNPDMKYIFYSNDDLYSSYAVTMARGLGYQNSYYMEGGLNEWYRLIMNSSFTGEKISPRENALFGTRFKARRLFNEINSLPDSLRIKYTESLRQSERELDGGCE